MILGRSPSTVLALIQAALNVVVVVLGVQLTAEQIAALNAFGAALITVIANSDYKSALATTPSAS